MSTSVLDNLKSLMESGGEEAMKSEFDKYDKDGSGYLEASELVSLATTMGCKINLSDLDADGDNRVSFDEFQVFVHLAEKYTHPVFKKAMIMQKNSATGISVFAGEAHKNKAFMQTASKAWRKLAASKNFDEKSLKKVFQSIDIDASGSLDSGEIRLAIKRIAPQITEMEITLMLATADIDRDGKIGFEEWKNLMMYDHESDVPYWQVYGERDMNVGLKLRDDAYHAGEVVTTGGFRK